MLKSLWYNPIVQRPKQLIYDMGTILRWATPNPFMTLPELGEQNAVRLKSMNEKGFMLVDDPALRAVADYLNEKYFKPVENNDWNTEVISQANGGFLLANHHEVYNTQDYVDGGIDLSADISFKDPELAPVIFNNDMHSVLAHFFNRQHYFRDHPVIQQINFRAEEQFGFGGYHTDHLHQISVMFLIEDITEEDTHLELRAGSHRNRNYLVNGIMPSEKKLEELSKNYNEIVHCVGKAGSLFVFDASTIHRAVLKRNTTRKILFLNITTGHNLKKFKESRQEVLSCPHMASLPIYTKNTLNKLP